MGIQGSEITAGSGRLLISAALSCCVTWLTLVALLLLSFNNLSPVFVGDFSN
ncbi:hypothetical protein J1N35_014416 [Gossypium stocksii]|uniref:Uncharacterized protein n=1 Tax=Gossypium stocksii TaxID=47602 RepID=A0A9D3VU20_9ROSI|nr:hypothetical protein J1N35_014416 [Gossypium stocksii]